MKKLKSKFENLVKFGFKFERSNDKAKYREMIFRVLKQNLACARHIACGAKILRNLGKALARRAANLKIYWFMTS